MYKMKYVLSLINQTDVDHSKIEPLIRVLFKKVINHLCNSISSKKKKLVVSLYLLIVMMAKKKLILT